MRFSDFFTRRSRRLSWTHIQARIGILLVAGALGLGLSPSAWAQSAVETCAFDAQDSGGADDATPPKSDINRYGFGTTDSGQQCLSAQWDVSADSVTADLNACSFLSTDASEYADAAFCINVNSNLEATATLYDCSGNTNLDKCTGNPPTITDVAVSCTIDTAATDPFAMADDDVAVTCTYTPNEFLASATVITTCSMSSGVSSEVKDCGNEPGSSFIKIAKDAGGENREFEFTVSGGAESITTVASESQPATLAVMPDADGHIAITESSADDWVFVSVDCDAEFSQDLLSEPAIVITEPGNPTTCTFTNQPDPTTTGSSRVVVTKRCDFNGTRDICNLGDEFEVTLSCTGMQDDGTVDVISKSGWVGRQIVLRDGVETEVNKNLALANVPAGYSCEVTEGEQPNWTRTDENWIDVVDGSIDRNLIVVVNNFVQPYTVELNKTFVSDYTYPRLAERREFTLNISCTGPDGAPLSTSKTVSPIDPESQALTPDHTLTLENVPEGSTCDFSESRDNTLGAWQGPFVDGDLGLEAVAINGSQETAEFTVSRSITNVFHPNRRISVKKLCYEADRETLRTEGCEFEATITCNLADGVYTVMSSIGGDNELLTRALPAGTLCTISENADTSLWTPISILDGNGDTLAEGTTSLSEFEIMQNGKANQLTFINAYTPTTLTLRKIVDNQGIPGKLSAEDWMLSATAGDTVYSGNGADGFIEIPISADTTYSLSEAIAEGTDAYLASRYTSGSWSCTDVGETGTFDAASGTVSVSAQGHATCTITNTLIPICETAFAYADGSNVLAFSDEQLNVQSNRWGWAIDAGAADGKYDLLAGQTVDVGDMTISGNTLTIISDTALIRNAHIHVGAEPETGAEQRGRKTGSNGWNPAPGQYNQNDAWQSNDSGGSAVLNGVEDGNWIVVHLDVCY